ncbi:MAG: DUF3841 domain-containing protein [Mogibacterium sp.]|nr:DUF3841 domain-containing protein [Mogibacterium sp.]
MIFVSRQSPGVLDELMRSGTYTVKEEYVRRKYTTITDHYAPLYRRLTAMAREHIDIPDGLLYPVWLSPEGSDPIPDSDGDVFLRLDIPEGSYILANDEVWDHMINHIYFPADMADELAHEAELARYGISSPSSLISGSTGNFYPLLRQKILRSWESIYTVTPRDPKHTVGLCWELRREWLL